MKKLNLNLCTYRTYSVSCILMVHLGNVLPREHIYRYLYLQSISKRMYICPNLHSLYIFYYRCTSSTNVCTIFTYLFFCSTHKIWHSNFHIHLTCAGLNNRSKDGKRNKKTEKNPRKLYAVKKVTGIFNN